MNIKARMFRLWGVLVGGILALFFLVSAHADVVDDLVPTVIQAESGGNPNAVSKDGSYGLMQVSYCVLQDYFNEEGRYVRGFVGYQRAMNIGELFGHILEPEFNVYIGTWYLYKIRSWLPEEYKNSRKHIVFAYNVGIGKLKKNHYQIPLWCKKHPNRIYRSIFNEKEM